MTYADKLLIIGAVDELLINTLGYVEGFSEEERSNVESKIEEVFDTSSPKELREGMVDLARNLYEDVTKEDE
ncbi:hypothetical protein [Salibacterium aidingense]|uniref:hypothetical protein n=1 Tax=Salibacterium aidingense TaxID=384933 RepID=UPI003BE20F20